MVLVSLNRTLKSVIRILDNAHGVKYVEVSQLINVKRISAKEISILLISEEAIEIVLTNEIKV